MWQEKPSWASKIHQNYYAAGALPRTPLGELAVLPKPSNWWGGGWLPLPRMPALALRLWPFGPCQPLPNYHPTSRYPLRRHSQQQSNCYPKIANTTFNIVQNNIYCEGYSLLIWHNVQISKFPWTAEGLSCSPIATPRFTSFIPMPLLWGFSPAILYNTRFCCPRIFPWLHRCKFTCFNVMMHMV